MKTNTKAKLLVARISFLQEELLIIEEENREALKAFQDFVLKDQYVLDKIKKNEETRTKEYQSSISEKKFDPIKPKLKTSQAPKEKKLYKKIVRKTHPDKLINLSKQEKLKKEKLFKIAKEAIENDDYYTLFNVAKKLDIFDIKITEKHVESFKSKIVNLELEINKIKNSIAWQWYTSDEETKKTIFEKYKTII
jgi:hypothetical protein